MSAPLLLSAFVIARDEADHIDRCLAALQFCDEIVVVVDAATRDDTAIRAARYTERVFVEPWQGYAAQKAFALAQCRGAWALGIDADEIVQPILARAIRAVADAGEPLPGRPVAYRLRRRVCYLGTWIRFGSFGNDWVLRLFVRSLGRVSDDRVHEGVRIDGRVARLPGILEHWSYRSDAHHRAKIEDLSDLWAEQEFARGRRARAADLWLRPAARWFRLVVLELGFLNGAAGFRIAALGARYVRAKYEKLQRKENRP